MTNSTKQTILNLAKAFAGESEARNRYTMYASVARKEGYEQISAVFLETAEQEREHASILYKFLVALKGQEEVPEQLIVDVAVPVSYGKTIDNLKAAIAGEDYERKIMYVEFADMAEKEGFDEIAAKMRLIDVAETHHSERYNKILKELEAGAIFKKEVEIEWMCRQCGYVHKGKEAPDACPLCGHAKAFYQRKLEEY
jgi:rubrerythrin